LDRASPDDPHLVICPELRHLVDDASQAFGVHGIAFVDLEAV
jgi:hypothetical protein